MVVLSALTTNELLQHVAHEANVSEAEMVLADRLAGALEEIDTLTAEVRWLSARTQEIDDGDDAGG